MSKTIHAVVTTDKRGVFFGEIEEADREKIDTLTVKDCQMCVYWPEGGVVGLAASAVWTRLYHHPIAWASVPTLLANLTASFDDEDRKRALSVIRGKRALCLDDLDKFNGGDWAAAQLFAAIDNAITREADLLITSNKTPGALAAHIGGDFGPALASRLASCAVVSVTGSDHRLTAKGAAA